MKHQSLVSAVVLGILTTATCATQFTLRGIVSDTGTGRKT